MCAEMLPSLAALVLLPAVMAYTPATLAGRRGAVFLSSRAARPNMLLSQADLDALSPDQISLQIMILQKQGLVDLPGCRAH